MLGVGNTVNVTPLLATPLTVTTTLPVVAPAGTGTTRLVADQLVGVAVVPLNFTVLVPCVAPKLVPVIVMDTPTAPLVGASDVMFGVGSTVNGSPLLATPPTVTTTLPVVAPAGTGPTGSAAGRQAVAAAVACNITVHVPCLPPKLSEALEICRPAAPRAGTHN